MDFPRMRYARIPECHGQFVAARVPSCYLSFPKKDVCSKRLPIHIYIYICHVVMVTKKTMGYCIVVVV